MLKKFALKKFTITAISLLIILIVYFFPVKDNYTVHTTLTYINPETIPIYLVDNNNYVSRFEIIKKNDNTLDIVEEIINNLTIDSKNTSHIPNNFKKIIPKNTKLLNKELENNILKIDFSKELLNIDKKHEEKLIESITYSLTELKDVKSIMIFVDGVQLTKMPSGKILPNTLDRSIGINKLYEIESMKEVSKITTYYVNKYDSFIYYTPITMVSNEKKDKVKVIIDNLKASQSYTTNLISYLNASTELQNYEILENSINISFNNEILSLDNNTIIEEVKYTIALSLRDTYNIEKTIFYIDDMLVDILFI